MDHPNLLYTYRYRLCQLQVGSADCGLFALAFASVLAAGGHPSAYHYDQQAMRKHLHNYVYFNRSVLSIPNKEDGEGEQEEDTNEPHHSCVLLLQDARELCR